MKTIINPIDNKRYSVFSKQGKQILQSYVKTFNNQRGGSNQQNLAKLANMTAADKRSMITFLLAQQRLRDQANQNDNQLNPVGISSPIGTRTIASNFNFRIISLHCARAWT